MMRRSLGGWPHAALRCRRHDRRPRIPGLDSPTPGRDLTSSLGWIEMAACRAARRIGIDFGVGLKWHIGAGRHTQLTGVGMVDGTRVGSAATIHPRVAGRAGSMDAWIVEVPTAGVRLGWRQGAVSPAVLPDLLSPRVTGMLVGVFAVAVVGQGDVGNAVRRRTERPIKTVRMRHPIDRQRTVSHRVVAVKVWVVIATPRVVVIAVAIRVIAPARIAGTHKHGGGKAAMPIAVTLAVAVARTVGSRGWIVGIVGTRPHGQHHCHTHRGTESESIVFLHAALT